MKKTSLISCYFYISIFFSMVKAAELTDSFLTSTSLPATESAQLPTFSNRSINNPNDSRSILFLSQKIQELEKSTREIALRQEQQSQKHSPSEKEPSYTPREESTEVFEDDQSVASGFYSNSYFLNNKKKSEYLKSTETHIRILALDGGGIRGLLELEFLAYLESRTDKHTTEMFHLMGGTSAGGQIVTLLSIKDSKTNKPKYTAKELLDILLEKFQNVFQLKKNTFCGLLGEKYKTTPIKKMLYELAGDEKFQNAIIPTIVTAYDVSQHTNKRLKTFSSTEKNNISAVDIMLATSAAPGYFQSHKIDGKEYSDGGLISNNPTITTLNEAKKMFPQASQFVIVSLGTGIFPEIKDAVTSLKHISLLSLAKHIPTLFLEGQKDAIEESLEYRSDVIRLRFNPIIKGKKIDLDDASVKNMARLRSAVFDMISKKQKEINSFISLLENTTTN